MCNYNADLIPKRGKEEVFLKAFKVRSQLICEQVEFLICCSKRNGNLYHN